VEFVCTEQGKVFDKMSVKEKCYTKNFQWNFSYKKKIIFTKNIFNTLNDDIIKYGKINLVLAEREIFMLVFI